MESPRLSGVTKPADIQHTSETFRYTISIRKLGKAKIRTQGGLTRGKELIQSEWSRLCGRKERQLYQEVLEVNVAS